LSPAQRLPVARATGTPGRGPHAGRRFHFVTMVLALCLISGVFIDGWAHINVASTKETLFTPWHGVLYSGFAATAVWMILPAVRGRRRGLLQSIPYGYGLGVVGLVLFLLGGLGDAIWHTLLGIETGIDALLSPTHLLLLTGGLLALTSPLRAAWVEVDTDSPSLLELLPALLSLTLTTTISAFFLGYAWHVPDPTPSLPVPPAALDETAPGHFAAERAVSYGIISRIVTTILLLGPVLFAVRRWRLPFGTVTILFTTVTGFMYVLLSDRTPPLLALTTVVAGLAADLLLRWLDVSADRPITVCVVGALVPIVLWSLTHGRDLDDCGDGVDSGALERNDPNDRSGGGWALPDRRSATGWRQAAAGWLGPQRGDKVIRKANARARGRCLPTDPSVLASDGGCLVDPG
jgi:hypothetical protein